MPDLRTLSRQQRRALVDQVRQLAQAGTPPKDIQAQLGLSTRSYARWAKQFSFRKCDLQSGTQDKTNTLTSANAVLAAVRAALSDNNEQEADRLLRTWKQTARRSRDLAALEKVWQVEFFRTGCDTDIIDIRVYQQLAGRICKKRGENRQAQKWFKGKKLPNQAD